MRCLWPVLLDKLKAEIGTRFLSGKVISCSCSHIGGHKYAGNLMVYGTDPFGKVTGHRYGYVTPDDVPVLMDSHIGKGEMIEKLWRVKWESTKEVKETKRSMESSPKLSRRKHSLDFAKVLMECPAAEDESSEVKSQTGPTNKQFDCLSDWIGSFEQENVLAAAAVVTAVATTAVSYSFYRRSS